MCRSYLGETKENTGFTGQALDEHPKVPQRNALRCRKRISQGREDRRPRTEGRRRKTEFGENQQWDDLDGWMIRMGKEKERRQEREKAIGVGACLVYQTACS